MIQAQVQQHTKDLHKIGQIIAVQKNSSSACEKPPAYT